MLRRSDVPHGVESWITVHLNLSAKVYDNCTLIQSIIETDKERFGNHDT